MHYLVTGGSGYIGRALCAALVAEGAEVTVLTRDRERARRVLAEPVRLIERLEVAPPVQAVINLAGANLAASRWTAQRRRELVASRVDTTRALVAWIAAQSARPRVLVSASAIGWYGPRGEERLHEDASPGADFAATLCRAWEAEALAAQPWVERVCIARLGVVISRDGGALARMLPAFRLGLGGPLGSGQQWMSWIGRGDAVRLLRWLATQPQARGVYNATAPEPVRNAVFASCLGKALGRPARLRMPARALRLLLGEMAQVLLEGQRVLPARALAAGFRFDTPYLSEALR